MRAIRSIAIALALIGQLPGGDAASVDVRERVRLRSPHTEFSVAFAPPPVPNAFVETLEAVGSAQPLKLSVLPERDVRGNLCCYEVSISPTDHPEQNLLAPGGNLHGLQPFDLAAEDFSKGPDRSAFGACRTIKTAIGIVVTITVQSATIVQLNPGESIFRELVVKIQVDQSAA